MNKRGVFEVGIALVTVFFIIALVLFATIDPLKETLDTVRDGTTGGDNTGLNCPGTPNFNDADYQNDTTSERLVRRPTCFVTGITMVWFVGIVLFATLVWVVANWRKPK